MEGRKKEFVLSKRLQALCRMVTPGNTVVDVGCDHGLLPVYLVQKKLSPHVLAMDVRTGPLAGAKENIAAYGLEDYIETRLSDGLAEYRIGEAQSLVCAGMGGRLMQKILTEGHDKAVRFEELILQPQSEITLFRRFLRESGYCFLEENILQEGGKYYFLMKVSCTGRDSNSTPCSVSGDESGSASGDESGGKFGNMPSCEEQELCDRYGGLLLEAGHPVLKQYLEDSLKTARLIENGLSENGSERSRIRLQEVREEIACLNRALSRWKDNEDSL